MSFFTIYDYASIVKYECQELGKMEQDFYKKADRKNKLRSRNESPDRTKNQL